MANNKYSKKELIFARYEARKSGDYELADRLRDELLENGIQVQDGKNGFRFGPMVQPTTESWRNGDWYLDEEWDYVNCSSSDFSALKPNKIPMWEAGLQAYKKHKDMMAREGKNDN